MIWLPQHLNLSRLTSSHESRRISANKMTQWHIRPGLRGICLRPSVVWNLRRGPELKTQPSEPWARIDRESLSLTWKYPKPRLEGCPRYGRCSFRFSAPNALQIIPNVQDRVACRKILRSSANVEGWMGKIMG